MAGGKDPPPYGKGLYPWLWQGAVVPHFVAKLKTLCLLQRGGDRCYRYASHPRFAHWCQTLLECYRTPSQVSFSSRTQRVMTALTTVPPQATMSAGGEGAGRPKNCM